MKATLPIILLFVAGCGRGQPAPAVPTVPPEQPAPPAQSVKPPQTLFVEPVDWKITKEYGDNFVDLAWKTEIRNDGAQDVIATVKLEWLDADGFILNESIQINQTIAAGSSQPLRGTDMMRRPDFDKLDKVEIKVTPRRR